MQNEKTDSPAREKQNKGPRQAKGCFLLVATIGLILLSLFVVAAAGIIIMDSIRLRGEEYTLQQRVERYKVACKFLWFDFKDSVSRKNSDSPQEDEP